MATLRTVEEIDIEIALEAAVLPHMQVRSSRALVFLKINPLLDERSRAARRAARRRRATDRP